MSRFENIPDVSFMGDITVAELKQKAIDLYNEKYTEITGKAPALSEEHKAILYADAQLHYQEMETMDKKARQNLLKYSSGDYLDNLGAGRCDPRKNAEYAVVTERFTLSAARSLITAIPQGTRFTSSGGKIFFETTEYTEILPGELYVDVLGRAMTGGVLGNNFAIGELNMLVDPIPYIASVENIDEPTGGADTESDDSFAERIDLSRHSNLTTGTDPAYTAFVKSYSSTIDDVRVTNPEDAKINIYITLKDGTEATSSFLEGLRDALMAKKTRPLTDFINCYNASRVNYKIDVEYTIYESSIERLSIIQDDIKLAVDDYISWQSARIGRNINHQELLERMKKAGAAKVTIKMPQDMAVSDSEIAFCESIKTEYKGTIED